MSSANKLQGKTWKDEGEPPDWSNGPLFGFDSNCKTSICNHLWHKVEIRTFAGYLMVVRNYCKIISATLQYYDYGFLLCFEQVLIFQRCIQKYLQRKWYAAPGERVMVAQTVKNPPAEGGIFQENSIKTCILSRVEQITSPGWMHETSARTWCNGKT